MNTNKPKVALSSCLAGDAVRFNGGHKRSRLCTDTLGQHFDFIKVCPEVAIGLPVPRPPIRLVKHENAIDLVETDNPSVNHSQDLTRFAKDFARQNSDICGFIATPNSPSCAVFSAKLYGSNGNPIVKRAGLFTEQLNQANPLLPIEEAGRLNDPGIRENFVMRVYTVQRWKTLVEQPLSVHRLTQFHSQHKYLLMSHDYSAYKTLGRLIAQLDKHNLEEQAQHYIAKLMVALSHQPSRGQQCNVLMHLMGHLKKNIDAHDKQEILRSIENFRAGVVPMVVPLTLLRHHFRRFEEQQTFVLNQVYLNPHPENMGLRSHIC